MRTTPTVTARDELPPSARAEPADAAEELDVALARLRVALPAAAAAAVEAGLELEAWMKMAWTAYLEQRPGLRERLEDEQLRTQLDGLRQQGRLARA